MPALQACFFPGNDHVLDGGAEVEQVPRGGDESCFLSHFEGAETLGYSGEFCRFDCDGGQGFFPRQTVSDCMGGVIR